MPKHRSGANDDRQLRWFDAEALEDVIDARIDVGIEPLVRHANTRQKLPDAK
jgi:hypothetical protein